MPHFDQARFDIRCEWGRRGLEGLGPTDVVVIVDVLSFTTSVDVAASRGVTVFPFEGGRDATIANAEKRRASIAGSLRNASAVAAWARRAGGTIAVVPAGERWSDGSLRPAVEDLVGAGAVLRNLPGSRSPEATVAIAAFESMAPAMLDGLRSGSSGRELLERGFARDVEIAAELDVSPTVPVLENDAFVDRTRR